MEHWDSGVPVVVSMPGPAQVRLRIDSQQGRLTLSVPITGTIDPPVNKLRHVDASVVTRGSTRFLEISTTDPRLVIDGHAMLMAVADRIELGGVDPTSAFETTLDTWGSILATRTRLSHEQEVGLFGELLMVDAVLATGVARATAWRGGLGEEHDFGFPNTDVETKTTSGEQRRHWIHGLSQLVETGAVPLWLVSLQITRGGDQGSATLPNLIARVLERASGGERSRVAHNLDAVGWDETQSDLYADTWHLRSVPLALRVSDALPRLTGEVLSRAGIDAGRLGQVSYELDLTGTTSSPDPPSALSAIVDHMGASVHG